MANAVEIRNLRKSHGGRKILDIREADFSAGEIVALVGPNGAGKTTLLECINGIADFEGGDVKIFGATISAASRMRMTLVFQNPYMFSSTVERNVAYGLRFRGGSTSPAVSAALKSVGLEGFEKRRAKTLSGGEAKRVAIARAVVLKPDILLLDEPTANIDHEHTRVVERLIKSLSRESSATVVIATHDREQAARIADRVFLIDGGALVPFHPDNHFKAELASEGGEKILSFEGGLRAVVSTDLPPGKVSCVIHPEDIIVSAAPVDTSARNRWSGAVTAVALENGRVRIAVDAGIPVVASVTRVSYEKLKPSIGSTLHLSFKASSIKVF